MGPRRIWCGLVFAKRIVWAIAVFVVLGWVLFFVVVNEMGGGVVEIKKISNFVTDRNRFAREVRLKGNAVRIGDSTRCCISRRAYGRTPTPLRTSDVCGKANRRGGISQKTCRDL